MNKDKVSLKFSNKFTHLIEMDIVKFHCSISDKFLSNPNHNSTNSTQPRQRSHHQPILPHPPPPQAFVRWISNLRQVKVKAWSWQRTNIFFWEFFFGQNFFGDQKYFQDENFFGTKFFLGPKFFLNQNYFRTKIFFWDPNFFSDTTFFACPNIFWLKMNFKKYNLCRQKTELLNLRLTKLARAKVLLYLEFGTEHQVLFPCNH